MGNTPTQENGASNDSNELPAKPPGEQTRDNNDILSVLMLGRRSLPSQQLAANEDDPTALAKYWATAGENLAAAIVSSRQTLSGLRNRPFSEQVDTLLDFTSKVTGSIESFIGMTSDLPEPHSSRHRSIGETLLPIALCQWNAYPPQNNGALIFDLHLRSYPRLDTGEFNHRGPVWLSQVLSLFNIADASEALPGAEEILSRSRSLAPALKQIKDEITALDRKIANMEKNLRETSDESVMTKVTIELAEARHQRSSKEQRIAPLYDRLTDVRPEQIPELYAALKISVAPKDEVCSTLAAASRSLERLIYLAVGASQGSTLEKGTSLIVPIPNSKGELQSQRVEISVAELTALGKDPSRLARVIEALTTTRRCLHCCLHATTLHIDLTSNEIQKMREALQEPLAHLRQGARGAVAVLLKHEDSQVVRATAQLLRLPVFVSPATSQATLPLDSAATFTLRTLATARFLKGEDHEAASLRDLLTAGPNSSNRQTLESARSFLKAGDTGRFAEIIESWLIAGAESAQPESILSIISLLHAASKDPELVRELRYQIPHIGLLKKLHKQVSASYAGYQEVLPEIVHHIVCSFSQSLRDYYATDKDGRLREAVEMYRFYLKNREILRGIPANHALKSGVAIFGPPGVGKTFFAQCLENELDDVTLTVLSPGEKDVQQDLLAYTKSIIESVKERETPTLLLIDEAETTVFDRMNPLATSDDRKHTNYLLQAIDDLRKNYPRVFILLASNYPERVDKAMKRPGRIELIFYLHHPGPDERKQIIGSTLKKEGVALKLTAAQLDELVSISDTFIPIQIIQAITETQRLYIPYRAQRGEHLEWSFELLKQRFELMALDARLRESERGFMGDGSHYEASEESPPVAPN
jgi:hypothetical protein